MALRAKEKYDPAKVDRIVTYLQMYRDKGELIDYEILVDGFKAVRRTNDLSVFPMFENFVGASTKAMEVLLYQGTSNNNDKYIFTFEDEPREGLNGINTTAQILEKAKELAEIDKRTTAFENLQKDNKSLQDKITNLEKEIEELEKDKATLEANQSPLKSFLGEFGSSFLESFLRRNPGLVAGLPGGEALAGFIAADNKRKEEEQSQSHQSTEQPEVSFKPKAESQTLSEQDKSAIVFVNQLKEQFSKEEFDKILLILQTLANDKTKIDLILNHVNIKKS